MRQRGDEYPCTYPQGDKPTPSGSPEPLGIPPEGIWPLGKIVPFGFQPSGASGTESAGGRITEPAGGRTTASVTKVCELERLAYEMEYFNYLNKGRKLTAGAPSLRYLPAA